MYLFLIMYCVLRLVFFKNIILVNGYVDDNKNFIKVWMMKVDDERYENEDWVYVNENEVDNENWNFIVMIFDCDCVIWRSFEVFMGFNERYSLFVIFKVFLSGSKEFLCVLFYKLVFCFWLDLNENVLEWSVDDVCYFVLVFIGLLDIVYVFREEYIDGYLFVLM